MLSSSLPPSFVHATLVALDLPHDLADRYAAPDDSVALRDRDRCPPQRPAMWQGREKVWPFPTC
jgi:hypothetical protein